MIVPHRCAWPNDKTLMRKLGAALPPTYSYIEIDYRLTKPDLLRSLCKGLAARRAETEGAGEVLVYCPGCVAEDVRVGEHVVLTDNVSLIRRQFYGDL